MNPLRAKIIGIGRHRLGSDGTGVTTLVAFHGCPLHCQYCLNPRSLGDGSDCEEYTPEKLYAKTRIDELYYLASGGGITFGGGEPAMRVDFIRRFRQLCGTQWRITLETSLNVPTENIRQLLPLVDFFIIDIKDMNVDTYTSYTTRSNVQVLENLRLIAELNRQSDCLVRIPLIPNYNSDPDREASRQQLLAMGYTNFDLFTYIIR